MAARPERSTRFRKGIPASGKRLNSGAIRAIEAKMMIEAFISNSLKNRGEHEQVADSDQVCSMVEALETRFGVRVFGNRPPWDNKEAPDGVFLPDGWRVIPEFVGDAACVLVSRDAEKMWIMGSGSSLAALLQDTPPFEFYVCDLNPSYLLCHNHHDFLVGWGRAEEWVHSIGCE